MDAIIRLPELLGWAIFGLVGIQVIGWAYEAPGKTTIAHPELRDRAYFFKGWAIFFGVLLIAVFCWLLGSSIFDEGWLANGFAFFLFVGIGVNLLDGSFGGPD